MKLDKEKRTESTIKTVKDFIKCLESCNPGAKISIWPKNLGFHVAEFPDDGVVCIHVVEAEVEKTKMKYEMIDSNILCTPIDEGTGTSLGGIILPDKMKDRPIKVKVIAVGPGDHLEDGSRCPMVVKVGMTLILLRKSGDNIQLDGKELIIIPEKYITLILSESDEEQNAK
jgi:chaperonin GroES